MYLDSSKDKTFPPDKYEGQQSIEGIQSIKNTITFTFIFSPLSYFSKP